MLNSSQQSSKFSTASAPFQCPFLLISKILFKPIILHESNSIMGSANKLFYFFSKKVIFGWGDKKKNENRPTF